MRRRRKNKNKTFIILLVFMVCIMTAGYAAFGIDLNINVKGNIKVIEKTVTFKTNLLKNSTLETLDGWIARYNGSTIEIDNNLKYKNFNAVKLQIDGSENWAGMVSDYDVVPYKDNTKYEQFVYLYRDSQRGDMTNTLRTYIPSYNGSELYSYNHYMNIESSSLPDRSWQYFRSVFTTPVNGATRFGTWHLDFSFANNQTSTIWFALPSFYELQEKVCHKYNKIGTLPEASKEGYTFIGWYTNEYEGEKIDEDFIVEDDIELFARFEKD